MQRQFLEKHGNVVFPKGVEYTTYTYEYTSGNVTLDENKEENSDNLTDEKSDESIHCLVKSNDYYLTMRLYSKSYLQRYIKANRHNRYAYLPIAINSNGYIETHDNEERIITKYVVVDLNQSMATLFDPMGDDTHMLYQSMYYRTNSIDNLLTSYFSDVEIVYDAYKSTHNLFKDSQRILSWCLWLVKTLLPERNYPGDAYEVLLTNISKIPKYMKTDYVDQFANQYLRVFDKEQLQSTLNQSVIDSIDSNTTETAEVSYNVNPVDQYDQLQAVLELSKRENSHTSTPPSTPPSTPIDTPPVNVNNTNDPLGMS